MTREWINTAIGYFVLLFLQIFVFNRIDASVYLNIQVYVMFILLLPVSFYPLASLLLSTFMGLSVDILSSGALGLHTAACATAGYLRPHLLRNMLPPADIQIEIPLPGKSPFRKYMTYTLILVLVHHFVGNFRRIRNRVHIFENPRKHRRKHGNDNFVRACSRQIKQIVRRA